MMQAVHSTQRLSPGDASCDIRAQLRMYDGLESKGANPSAASTRPLVVPSSFFLFLLFYYKVKYKHSMAGSEQNKRSCASKRAPLGMSRTRVPCSKMLIIRSAYADNTERMLRVR